jgi:hypothetical protein
MRATVLPEGHGNPVGQEQAILPVKKLYPYCGPLHDISVAET